MEAVVCKQLAIEPPVVKDDERLVDGLQMDDLDFVEVAMELEVSELSITIPDVESEWVTFQDIVNTCCEALGERLEK